MSWLIDEPAGDEFAALLALTPDTGERFARVHDMLWTMLDPKLLELARLRMAQLLACRREQQLRYRPAIDAGLSEATISQLAAWPDAPVFSAADRACLALTEQYLMDVKAVTDEMAADIRDELGERGLFAFTNALAVFEAVARMSLALGVAAASDGVTVLDRLPRPADLTGGAR